jgi:hypothetical protein
MTLFSEIARRMRASEPPGSDIGLIAERADAILRAAKTEGYPPCAFTLKALGA